MFHQVEGLAVDANITFCDLKGTLDHAMKGVIRIEREDQLPPVILPFHRAQRGDDGVMFHMRWHWQARLRAVPALQTDRLDRNSGCGMVDPNVYGFVGYDPKKVSGFAFGMGADRIAILKYGVDDIQFVLQRGRKVFGTVWIKIRSAAVPAAVAGASRPRL